ncbi:MAG TPA: DsbA family protein [Candidatus Dojkabacteria bacterium]|nr:DsbA family protein [Candidatus Dojkabacteria bacterium]
MSKLIIQPNNKDHIQGNEKSNVTLVEYGDFECPYCGEAYPIVKEIQKIKGDVLRFVFRNFPLSEMHPYALHAAYAAEAAGKQHKFWEMHDILFENQENLEDKNLRLYAEKLSLDIDQFTNDMNSDEVAKKVQEDIMGGIKSGVNGTPTFFINGLRFDGSHKLDSLLKAIEKIKFKNTLNEKPTS